MSVDVTLPDAGDSDEIEVVAVETSVGAPVAVGDVLFEVATDKANVDIESPASGVIASVLVSEGDIVGQDQILATIETA